MKKLIFVLALTLSSVLYKAADAQVSLNINIGQQPVWGPVGYDYVDYYYFPDADIYYNVPRGQYVYFDGRSWVFSLSLPSRWNRFDLFNSYKVVINEPNPFYRNDYWKSRYMPYRGQHQNIIYYSREPRYYVIQNHPEHNRWIESNRGYNNRVDNRTVYNNRGHDNSAYENRVINQGSRISDNQGGKIVNSSNTNIENHNRIYQQNRTNELEHNRTVTQERSGELRTGNNNNFGQRHNDNNRSNERNNNSSDRRGNGRRF